MLVNNSGLSFRNRTSLSISLSAPLGGVSWDVVAPRRWELQRESLERPGIVHLIVVLLSEYRHFVTLNRLSGEQRTACGVYKWIIREGRFSPRLHCNTSKISITIGYDDAGARTTITCYICRTMKLLHFTCDVLRCRVTTWLVVVVASSVYLHAVEHGNNSGFIAFSSVYLIVIWIFLRYTCDCVIYVMILSLFFCFQRVLGPVGALLGPYMLKDAQHVGFPRGSLKEGPRTP